MKSESDGQNKEKAPRILRPTLALLRRAEDEREQRYKKAEEETKEWLRQNPDAAKAFEKANNARGNSN